MSIATLSKDEGVTAKSITNEIMEHFSRPAKIRNAADARFFKRLAEKEVQTNLDGMHMLTILFQCARSKRLAKSIISIDVVLSKLKGKTYDIFWLISNSVNIHAILCMITSN
jgi:hypothetical protein